MRFVAIHGLGCSASQGWPRVAATLGPDHGLVAPPLLGADGPTDAPPGSWGIRAQAARIAPLVGPDDVLIGHSMGGAIAIRVTEHVRPRRLVLVEPHVVPRAGFIVAPALRLGPQPSSEARAAFLARMSQTPTGEGTYADWIARWDWRVFHAMSLDLANGDGGERSWIEVLASLDRPVHLLWGARSDDAGEDEHRVALERLGILARVVADSAHFIPSEAPEAMAEALNGMTV